MVFESDKGCGRSAWTMCKKWYSSLTYLPENCEDVAMTTKEVIDRIVNEPGVGYELTWFENFGKPIHENLDIHVKTVMTGKDAGETKCYVKSFISFSSGNDKVQVYVERGQSAPEESVRLVDHNDTIPDDYSTLSTSSSACRMQVERVCSGAFILNWEPPDIRKLRIPLLRQKTMERIASFVNILKGAKRESVQLRERATPMSNH